MEILKVVPVMKFSWWTAMLAVAGIIFLFAMMYDLASVRFNTVRVLIYGFICVACMITALLLPKTYESGEKTYTVEITDSGQFQTLIDEGYTFEKLYDNRDIYEIGGKPLEE